MPSKMPWIEWLFSNFPISRKKVLPQILLRIGFLAVLWAIGLLAYAVDGMISSYFAGLDYHFNIFGSFVLVLVGSYFYYNALERIIGNTRSILSFDKDGFLTFQRRLKQIIYSILPCLVIYGVLLFLSGIPAQIETAIAEGLQFYQAWRLFFALFGALLTATVIWMFATIWLIIFSISRQPLNLKLASKPQPEFRELSLLALWFSFFYFIGITFGNLTFFSSVTGELSISSIIFSPYMILVAVGVAGVLFPFYNIHMVLLKAKNEKLQKISQESNRLMQQLDDVLTRIVDNHQRDELQIIHYQLYSLELKEKYALKLNEWPIDIAFISKLMLLVLIPVISRVIAGFISL